MKPISTTELFDDYSPEMVLRYRADGLPTRLDRWLAEAAPSFSRSQWQRWIRAGQVAVDGTVVTSPKTLLHPGSTVVAVVEPEVREEAVPQPQILPVVFADDHLLVLDKPAGWVVHPGAGNRTGTLMNYLLAFDPVLAEVPRAGIVHRLDKETSGLMVVARTLVAQQRLVAALAAREISRRYWAIVYGVVAQPLTLTGPIGRHPKERVKMAVVPQGKPAVTRVTPLERFGTFATLVQCDLETGRTHQIRVHLAHAGHPLLGDPLYGDRRTRHPLIARQALHAVSLSFVHPVSGEPLVFESPLPPDIDRLRAHLAAGGEASQ
jgi:23S rRNA pseudouridine1911/1915/1917 synthase